MSDSKPVVFVVDDDPSVRESLALLFESADLQSQTFASGQEFLSHDTVRTPNCLVLDVHLPDLNGLELQTLVADRPYMPIIFITGQGDVPTTVRAMKAGAVEFLIKPFSDTVLLEAISCALDRSGAVLSADLAMHNLRAKYAALSRREREVMTLVASGLLNKQVGGRLGISEITVKAHRGRVMRKMESRSLADLVTKSAKLGVSLPSSS